MSALASGEGSSSTTETTAVPGPGLPDGYIMDLETGWGKSWILAPYARVIEIGCMPLRDYKPGLKSVGVDKPGLKSPEKKKLGLNIIVDLEWDPEHTSLEEYVVDGMKCDRVKMKEHMSGIFFGDTDHTWKDLETAIKNSREDWECEFPTKTEDGNAAKKQKPLTPLEKVELFQEKQKFNSQPAIVPRKAAFLAFMGYCGTGPEKPPPVWYAHNGNGFDYQVMECESKRLFGQTQHQIAVEMKRGDVKEDDGRQTKYRLKKIREYRAVNKFNDKCGFKFIGYDTLSIFENFTSTFSDGRDITGGQAYHYDDAGNVISINKKNKQIRKGTQEALASSAGILYGGFGAHTALSDCMVLRQLLLKYDEKFGATVVKRFPERKETIVIRPLFF